MINADLVKPQELVRPYVLAEEQDAEADDASTHNADLAPAESGVALHITSITCLILQEYFLLSRYMQSETCSTR